MIAIDFFRGDFALQVWLYTTPYTTYTTCTPHAHHMHTTHQ
jgi:hypothetical protein